jgi:hypothetical protein
MPESTIEVDLDILGKLVRKGDGRSVRYPAVRVRGAIIAPNRDMARLSFPYRNTLPALI